MVEVTCPTIAVFISPARPAIADLSLLRQMQVQALVFRDSVLEEAAIADFKDIDSIGGYLTAQERSMSNDPYRRARWRPHCPRVPLPA